MRSISPKEAKTLADGSQATIVDIREADERTTERIPGSVHIPMTQLLQRKEELSSYPAAILQCASGSRSMMAAQFLEAQGLPNILDLAGGLIAWGDAGLPVDR